MVSECTDELASCTSLHKMVGPRSSIEMDQALPCIMVNQHRELEQLEALEDDRPD